MDPELLPAIFALTSAALFGLAINFQRLGIRAADGRTAAAISIYAFAAIFWLLSPFFVEWHWWGTRAALIFAFCGLLVPLIGQLMHMASIEHIGASTTGAMSIFAPAFAIVPAVLLLGETFNVQGGIGLAVMALGILAVVQAGDDTRKKFALWLLILPLGASLARGIVQPTAKFAYAEVPSPVFGTLVMATVSSIAVTVYLLSRDRATIRLDRGQGLNWLIAGGVANGVGLLFLQSAIAYGEVIVASSLSTTVPLWTLALGGLFFKENKIGPWHIGAGVLTTVGAVILVTR